ncbi:MAG: hypothetical protein OEY86_19945 [Nitrospira sp.]|nr:hypothetical protein [Nitrospira sp.]
MDVESLAQIRHIVTEAAQGVREGIAALGTELRSEITATKQHMGVLTSDITATKQHMNVLTEEITGTSDTWVCSLNGSDTRSGWWQKPFNCRASA